MFLFELPMPFFGVRFDTDLDVWERWLGKTEETANGPLLDAIVELYANTKRFVISASQLPLCLPFEAAA
jgi:hypothetical protein